MAQRQIYSCKSIRIRKHGFGESFLSYVSRSELFLDMYVLPSILSFLVLSLFSANAAPEPSGAKGLDSRPECQCGSNVQSKRTRVVGGADTIKGQFPYATGLIYHNPEVNMRDMNLPMPYCGGTLITDRHILTAAHCLRDRSADHVFLDVGDHNLEISIKDKILRNSSTLLMHPEYTVPGFRNDIAIIEMDQPVDWDSGIRASWLASPDVQLDGGTKVTVYGWGRLSYHGSRPTILQSVEMPIMKNDECQKRFSSPIADTMMCAGGEEGRDACIGDSGSGLTIRLDDKYALVGVVSFGKNCALPDVAGVYTRTGRYLDWIHDETLNSACKPCIAS